MGFLFRTFQKKKRDVTGSHGAFPGESQQPFLLQDETSSDKQTGADGQRQADVEIVSASLRSHGEGVILCHIEQRTQEPPSSVAPESRYNT